MPIKIHNFVSTLIRAEFACHAKALEEKKEGMSIRIDGSQVKYEMFSFDRDLDKTNYPKGLYPFFNKVRGAHSVCDYTIFVTNGSELYVLLVELKKGDSDTAPQLKAGECMARYIVETVNRLNKTNYVPQYRHISVKGSHLVRKGKTKMQPVIYTNNAATFEGRIFCLKEFLK